MSDALKARELKHKRSQGRVARSLKPWSKLTAAEKDELFKHLCIKLGLVPPDPEAESGTDADER